MYFDRLTHYLKQPYRREFHPVYSTLIITLLVLFVIAVLKPFGIAKASMTEYLLILISTTIGVTSGMLIAHYLFPSLFKKYYALENWTVGKDIFQNIFSIFVVAITNGIAHGICQMLYQDMSQQHFLHVFTNLFIATLILSPIPVLVLAIINHNRTLTFTLRQMQELNPVLIEKEHDTSENETLLVLTGATKESVELSANMIRYIEASGNYVKIKLFTPAIFTGGNFLLLLQKNY